MFPPRGIHPRDFFVALFVGLGAQLALPAEGPASPAELRTEYLRNPVGIDVRTPRFAWAPEHSGRGEVQSAYQILVATGEELLARDQGDQSDSGTVAWDDTTQAVYAGKPLESGHAGR